MNHHGTIRIVLSILAGCCIARLAGQERALPSVPGQDAPTAAAAAAAEQPKQVGQYKQEAHDTVTPADYMLGPDDRIEIFSPDLGEVSGKPLSIGMSGFIDLPLAGRIHATGLTVQDLQDEIVKRLREYVREPSVVVTVMEFHSQPVSVLGSVGQPGIHQLEGRKTLVEMLSEAGGIRPDAGYTVEVTRSLEWGRIPLLNAKDDSTGRFSVAEVRLDAIMSGRSPQENILVRPHDIISVPRAHLVYVIGEVSKAGGFVLEQRESISVLQALALAGGLGSYSSPRKAKILRGGSDPAKRIEIPVDLKKIIAGQEEDLAMKPEDILFVPTSVPKKAGVRAAEAALQTATGVVIWRGGNL